MDEHVKQHDSIESITERAAAPRRIVFEIAGHAITTATWISLCVVTVFYIYNKTTFHIDGKPNKILFMVLLATGVLSVISSGVIFFSFFFMVSEVVDEFFRRPKNWISKWLSHYQYWISSGCAALLMIITLSLSVQALQALNLLG